MTFRLEDMYIPKKSEGKQKVIREYDFPNMKYQNADRTFCLLELIFGPLDDGDPEADKHCACDSVQEGELYSEYHKGMCGCELVEHCPSNEYGNKRH